MPGSDLTFRRLFADTQSHLTSTVWMCVCFLLECLFVCFPVCLSVFLGQYVLISDRLHYCTDSGFSNNLVSLWSRGCAYFIQGGLSTVGFAGPGQGHIGLSWYLSDLRSHPSFSLYGKIHCRCPQTMLWALPDSVQMGVKLDPPVDDAKDKTLPIRTA